MAAFRLISLEIIEIMGSAQEIIGFLDRLVKPSVQIDAGEFYEIKTTRTNFNYGYNFIKL